VAGVVSMADRKADDHGGTEVTEESLLKIRFHGFTRTKAPSTVESSPRADRPEPGLGESPRPRREQRGRPNVPGSSPLPRGPRVPRLVQVPAIQCPEAEPIQLHVLLA
jgi:hypothetical protein